MKRVIQTNLMFRINRSKWKSGLKTSKVKVCSLNETLHKSYRFQFLINL